MVTTSHLLSSLLELKKVSWWKILEDLRIIRSIFNKICLIMFDGLTKEMCIASQPYFHFQLALPAEKKEWWRVDPRSHKPFCLLSCTRVPSPPCLFDFPAGWKTGCKMPLNQKLQRTLQLLRVIHSMRIRKGKKAGKHTTSPRVSKAGP